MMIVILIVGVLLAMCGILHVKFSYWKNLNINQVNKSALSLTLKYCTNWRLSYHMMQLYRMCRNKNWEYAGTFLFTRPLLFVASPKLLHEITAKHKDNFQNRGSYHNNESPEDMNLFNMKQPEWLKWRKLISRSFVSSQYLDIFKKYLKQTVNDLKMEDNNQDGVDIFKVCNYYACNVAQHLFLGINQPQIAFDTCKKLRTIFKPNKLNKLTDILSYYWPSLLHFFNASEFPRDACTYVKTILRQSIRNPIIEDSILWNLILKMENYITEENIVGVLSALFLGGLKSTTPLLTYACYELANANEVQEELRREITSILKENDISNESINKMTYMKNVLNEVIRLHNGGPLLIRECNADCNLESINLTVKKGTLMIASLRGILLDEEYFPRAMDFDPDRFKYPSDAFLPFGMGEHKCIGNQFALLQTKVFLVQLLSKYKLTVNEKTQHSTNGDIRLGEGSIYLNITSI